MTQPTDAELEAAMEVAYGDYRQARDVLQAWTT
jgi:hypothetical protein